MIKFPNWEREEVTELFTDSLIEYNKQHNSDAAILSITKENKYHFTAWLSNEDSLELTFLTPKEEREMFNLEKQRMN